METSYWLTDAQLHGLFAAISINNPLSLREEKIFSFANFVCVIICLFCEGKERFAECFKWYDIDESGSISWIQLEQIVMVACHGDPSFVSELTGYFKIKFDVSFDEDGKPVRVPPKREAELTTTPGAGAKKKAPADTDRNEEELSEVRISLDELNQIVDGMTDWMNSTGWEWPSLDRPLTAGLTSVRGAIARPGITRGGMGLTRGTMKTDLGDVGSPENDY